MPKETASTLSAHAETAFPGLSLNVLGGYCSALLHISRLDIKFSDFFQRFPHKFKSFYCYKTKQ